MDHMPGSNYLQHILSLHLRDSHCRVQFARFTDHKQFRHPKTEELHGQFFEPTGPKLLVSRRSVATNDSLEVDLIKHDEQKVSRSTILHISALAGPVNRSSSKETAWDEI